MKGKTCGQYRLPEVFALAGGLDADSPRLLSTASFLKEVGVAGGLRKEVQGFAERWIYGRGTPHIRAAFQWHRRASHCMLMLRRTTLPFEMLPCMHTGDHGICSQHCITYSAKVEWADHEWVDGRK